VKHISELLTEVVAKLVGQEGEQIVLEESDKENAMSLDDNSHTRTHDKFALCPRCEGFIPNNDTPGAYPGAISRLDNKTEICSECGTIEAMLDWQGELTDWRKPQE
jgi:uncharacterized protein with PIN domain